MSLIKSASKLYSASLFNSLASFVAVIYFARALGADELGVYFLFVAVLGMCSIPADFGIDNAMKKRISEGKQQGKYLQAAILLKLGTVLFVSFIIFLLRDYVNGYLGQDLTAYLIAGLVVQQFAHLFTSVLHGELRVGETASIEVINKISWIGLGVILTVQEFGATGLVSAHICGLVIQLLLSVYKKDITVTVPSRHHFSSLFNYSKYSLVSSIGGYTYSWIDVLVIGYFFSTNYVAAYEVAWRITSVVILVAKSIATTIFPQISEWSSTDAKNKISDLLTISITASLFISIPGFFGILILSEEVLELLYGSEYLIASTALVILMSEKILQSVHKVWGYSLQAIDRPDQAALATVVSVGTNIGLNIILVPVFGLVGAAVATTVSFGINTGLHGYYLGKHIVITIEYQKIAWCALSAIGMSLFLSVLLSGFVIRSTVTLFSVVLLGVIVYLAVALVYQPLRDDMYTVLNELGA